MGFPGWILLGAVVAGSVLYHTREMRRLFQQTKARRPQVFLVIKGDPDDRTSRRPVVLRNGGDLPARQVTVRVTRDAMIWTNDRGVPDPAGGEDRAPFSTLPVCRHGVVGIPPGGEHPVAFLTPAGRWMQDRQQLLECTIAYFDGEGARYEESVGLEYLA
jgi:hypothetical protein